ncbi:hypothetical protein ACWKSP_02105 [Micromonosporaceae bacterium Da 78-11]
MSHTLTIEIDTRQQNAAYSASAMTDEQIRAAFAPQTVLEFNGRYFVTSEAPTVRA